MNNKLVGYLETIKDTLTGVTAVEGFCTRKEHICSDGKVLSLVVIDVPHFFAGTIITDDKYVSLEMLSNRFRILSVNAGNIEVKTTDDISLAVNVLENFVEEMIG